MNRKNNYDYFGTFQTCADYACQAAKCLHETLLSFDPATFPTHMEEMHRIENGADKIKHEMTKRLAHEFITPIEREDIVALAQALDDVTDAVDDVMRHVYMFNLTEIRPEMISFSELIVRCCAAMRQAVEEFRNFKKSKRLEADLIEVNNLEGEGDSLHAQSVHALFVSAKSTIDTLVWMRLYDHLEDCLDACEDVTDIVESIIMKNS